jgi:hypothetical protein
MKKTLTILSHKENTNQATLRFYFTPVTIATIKNITTNKSQQGCGEKEPSHTAVGNVN